MFSLVVLISCLYCKKHIVSNIYILDNIKNVMTDLNCLSNLVPVIVRYMVHVQVHVD